MLALFFLISLTYATIHMNTTTRMFEDDFGRAVIFHGVNVVVKLAPYIPITDHFDPQMSLSAEDITNMNEWGFNFVRLGVMWQAVETSPGVYNTTYLSQINTLINQLGAAGIYTLIDAHQDVFARKICGEGVPNFYAQNLSDSCGELAPVIEGIGACTPFSSFNFTLDSDGNPSIQDCLKHLFALYYSTPEAADAFKRLYKNIDGLQDKFLAYWNVVSSYYVNNNYVVGYDPINEPLPADLYEEPSYAVPGVFDKEGLQPLYIKFNNMLRKNDMKKIIFFEPIQNDMLPILGGIVFNTGFDQAPGGPSMNNLQVLNDHTYCCQVHNDACIANNGEPPLSLKSQCAKFHKDRLRVRSDDAAKLGVGLMITEFGGCTGSVDCATEITAVTDACDLHLVGWSYWMFKGYNDYTTAGNLLEGLYDNNGELEPVKLKALQRTYAQAYQGIPIKLFFIAETGYFSTSFTLSPSVNAPTIVFLNEEVMYPNGFDLSVSNTLNLKPTISQKGNYIYIQFMNPQISTSTIVISAKKSETESQ